MTVDVFEKFRILVVDPARQVQARSAMILHRIGNRVTVVWIPATAVPPVSVEHQVNHPVGAVCEEPPLRLVQVLSRAEADPGHVPAA